MVHIKTGNSFLRIFLTEKLGQKYAGKLCPDFEKGAGRMKLCLARRIWAIAAGHQIWHPGSKKYLIFQSEGNCTKTYTTELACYGHCS